jgi:membrane-associated protein
LESVLDLFLHLDKHLEGVTRAYGGWTYALLFGIIFAETGLVITPFLPGDSLLFMAGALAALGQLSVWLLLALLFVAAVLGDTVNYAVGQFLGPRLFHGGRSSRFLKKEHLDRTHAFFEKHGAKTIIIARFVPIVRTFAPFVAGMGSMSYGRFVLYNIVGAAIWVGVCVTAGYFFGNLPFVRRNFSLVVLAIIAVSLVPAVVEFVNHRLATRRAAAASAAAADPQR